MTTPTADQPRAGSSNTIGNGACGIRGPDPPAMRSCVSCCGVTTPLPIRVTAIFAGSFAKFSTTTAPSAFNAAPRPGLTLGRRSAANVLISAVDDVDDDVTFDWVWSTRRGVPGKSAGTFGRAFKVDATASAAAHFPKQQPGQTSPGFAEGGVNG